MSKPANREATAHKEWTAIPVTGECALASLETSQPEAGQPPYVTGVVKTGDERIAVLDLSRLISPEVTHITFQAEPVTARLTAWAKAAP